MTQLLGIQAFAWGQEYCPAFSGLSVWRGLHPCHVEPEFLTDTPCTVPIFTAKMQTKMVGLLTSRVRDILCDWYVDEHHETFHL